MAGAEVSLSSLNRRLTTDSLGRARFTGIQGGWLKVAARRVGFEPAEGRFRIAADTTEFSVFLKRLPVMLDTIRVAAKCPWRGFSGFECRRREANGLFLDHVAIDSAKVDDVAKLFYDRPGYKVYRRERTGIPYVVSTEGWRCLVTIVNGIPVSLANPAPKYASEIIAVEAYVEARFVPKDYQKYSWPGKFPCGLINYWTSPR